MNGDNSRLRGSAYNVVSESERAENWIVDDPVRCSSCASICPRESMKMWPETGFAMYCKGCAGPDEPAGEGP